MLLENKVAVVTGGSRGIGLAAVKAFLQEGAAVVLCASRQETADHAVAELKAELPDAVVEGICPNLADAAAVQAAMDAVAAKYGEIRACSGNTSIFLYPGVKFNCIDGLITNFHLPESTLIMLVSALYGYEKTMHAYEVAVAEKYRFFSFGDAMLIV